MDNVLDLLLGMERTKLPEKAVKLKRLSKECGQDVIFTLRALPYDRVAEIKESESGDMTLDILLAGIISPSLKNEELLKQYHSPTPAELLKAMLLAGEIEELSREIEKLSGYRTATVEDVKKK